MAGIFKQKTEAEKAAMAARKADEAWQRSPQGKAVAAYNRGDEFFQVEIPHASITGFTNAAFNAATAGTVRRQPTRTDLLGQIEEAGWRLEHADWVYVQTGQNSRDKFMASGQQVVVTGEVLGIYLFRRDDGRQNRVNSSRRATLQPDKEIAATEVRPRTKLSCFKCQHEMSVPVNQLDFICEACGTKLRRKIEI